MSIQDLGSIGELIAAIATLGTLVFLALQIKHGTNATKENTKALQASMTRNGDDSVSDFSYRLAENPELNQLWVDGSGGAQLSQLDQVRYFRLCRNYFGIHAISFIEFEATNDTRGQCYLADFIAHQINDQPGLAQVWVNLESTPFAMYDTFIEAVNARIGQDNT